MAPTSNAAAGATGALLEVRDQRTRFATGGGTLTAVDGVSFDLGRGETLGVVGESGSGKSVLARSIMNLLPRNASVAPESTVRFDGRDVRNLSLEERKHFWGMEIGMIFQDPMTSLNPVRRIGRQITDPLRYHLGLSRADASARAVELLGHVGLSEPAQRLSQYPHELSGGMRQRVMIAIALSCRPRLLIADEPTTALDVTVQRQILGLLSTLQGELHMAMMLITHDLGVVANNTRRVIVMYAGQDVETASTTTIFTSVRHPYTEALMRSIPHLDHPPHAPLRAIAGRPPDMRNPPVGCRFAPRCPYAQEQCVREVPPRFEEPGGHTYRCFYPVGTDAGREAQERNERAGVTAAGLVVQPVSTSTATATSPVTATV